MILSIGNIVRVSALCGVMDFRNRLACVVGVDSGAATCALLANRARRAKLMDSMLTPIDTLSDQEMALLTDTEIVAIAAYRMGV